MNLTLNKIHKNLVQEHRKC